MTDPAPMDMSAPPVMPDDARHRVLYRSMGAFIARWSQVEWHLILVVSGLLKTDIERARIVLAAQINFRAKRDLIARLGRAYLPDEHLSIFETMVARLKHLSEKRNLLAHRRAYHLGRGTFRFFSDEDPTQPNTFGRYQDVQTATIRAWTKELDALLFEIHAIYLLAISGPLLEHARLIPEPESDRD